MKYAITILSFVAAAIALAPYDWCSLCHPKPPTPGSNSPYPPITIDESKFSQIPSQDLNDFTGYQYDHPNDPISFTPPFPPFQPPPPLPLHQPPPLPHLPQPPPLPPLPQHPPLLPLGQQQYSPFHQPQYQPLSEQFPQDFRELQIPQDFREFNRPQPNNSPHQQFGGFLASSYSPPQFQYHHQSHFYNQHQSLNSPENFPPTPLQFQPLGSTSGTSTSGTSTSGVKCLSSYQVDSGNYGTSRTDRAALDDMVLNYLRNIMKDNKSSLANNSEYHSRSSDVFRERSAPSVNITSFFQDSPVSPKSVKSAESSDQNPADQMAGSTNTVHHTNKNLPNLNGTRV